MSWLARAGRAGFRIYDTLYRVLFRLQAVGPMLFVGRARYRGEARRFPDGIRLEAGDVLGTLHFNNARIAKLPGAGTGGRTTFGFLLRASLQELARRTTEDSVLRQIRVYRGVTWLQPHGRRLGFLVEPYPGGPGQRLLRAHFRLLLRTFSPREADGAIRPHVFWLTRRQLVRHFGGESRQ